MSTVPDTIAAVPCGMEVVAASAITNLAAGLDARGVLSHEQKRVHSKATSERFCRWGTAFVAQSDPGVL